jgi:hypothetical protein
VKLESFISKIPKSGAYTLNVYQTKEDDYMIHMDRNLGSRTVSFQIRELVDEQNPTMTPLPKFPVYARAILNAEGLLKLLQNDLGSISDHVSMLTKQGEMSLSGRGEEGKCETTLRVGEAEVVSIDASDKPLNLEYNSSGPSSWSTSEKIEPPIAATYSLEYIVKVLKALEADNITLEHGNKMPMRIRQVLPSSSFLDFLLAPRVQDIEPTRQAAEEPNEGEPESHSETVKQSDDEEETKDSREAPASSQDSSTTAEQVQETAQGDESPKRKRGRRRKKKE